MEIFEDFVCISFSTQNLEKYKHIFFKLSSTLDKEMKQIHNTKEIRISTSVKYGEKEAYLFKGVSNGYMKTNCDVS